MIFPPKAVRAAGFVETPMTDPIQAIADLRAYVDEALGIIATTLEQQDHRINAAVQEAEIAREQYVAMLAARGVPTPARLSNTVAPKDIRVAIAKASRQSAERMDPKGNLPKGELGD